MSLHTYITLDLPVSGLGGGWLLLHVQLGGVHVYDKS